jgi:hypothetical protein
MTQNRAICALHCDHLNQQEYLCDERKDEVAIWVWGKSYMRKDSFVATSIFRARAAPPLAKLSKKLFLMPSLSPRKET